MNILITVNSSWNLVNFRSSFVQSLIDEGHRVTAVVPVDDTTPALEAMGCNVVPLKMDNKGTSPTRDGALVLRLFSIFRRERPDVILSYTIKNNAYGAIAARALGIPFIPNVTGLGVAFITESYVTWIVRGIYRIAFAQTPVVFFQNRDDRALFVSLGLVDVKAARLLPGSGIPLSHFSAASMPNHDDQPVFLLIARMLWDKGIGEFVDAARQVRRTHPGARFQLLGFLGAQNRSAIDPKVIEGWVAEGVVEYLGAAADVRPFIEAADCIVLPSYREGMPRTMLEAAAMARPVITTDTPGCREIVDDGITGFLCHPRDASDLASKILAMINAGADGRAVMGALGRRKMELEFDESLVIEAYRAGLSDVCPASTSKTA